jgi:hypothetical protein
VLTRKKEEISSVKKMITQMFIAGDPAPKEEAKELAKLIRTIFKKNPKLEVVDEVRELDKKVQDKITEIWKEMGKIHPEERCNNGSPHETGGPDSPPRAGNNGTAHDSQTISPNIRLRRQMYTIQKEIRQKEGMEITAVEVENLEKKVDNLKIVAENLLTRASTVQWDTPEVRETEELLDEYEELYPYFCQVIAGKKTQIQREKDMVKSQEEQLSKSLPGYKYLPWNGRREDFLLALESWKPLELWNVSEPYKAQTIKKLIQDPGVSKLIENCQSYGETLSVLWKWFGSDVEHLQRILLKVDLMEPPKTTSQEFENLIEILAAK